VAGFGNLRRSEVVKPAGHGSFFWEEHGTIFACDAQSRIVAARHGMLLGPF
jgi:hypothetical protein